MTHIEDNLHKYCVMPGEKCLLMTKTREPYRLALIENSTKQMLVNSNIFILKVDAALIDLYYVKAFLESAAGKQELNRLTVGSGISVLNKEGLLKLDIPRFEVSHEKDIADKNKSMLLEIVKSKKKIKDCLSEIEGLF